MARQVGWSSGSEEVDVLRLGDVAEGAVDVARRSSRRSSLTSTVTVPDSILDRSRMSLISMQQVGAGQVDGLGETRPACPTGCRRGSRTAGQDQDQQAVERRAQLVRHVGQELALVLGGQRQLLGLFLERLAGLLDLAVLALHLLRSARRAGNLGPSPAVPRWRLLQLLSCRDWVQLLGAATATASAGSSVRMLASIVLSTMPDRLDHASAGRGRPGAAGSVKRWRATPSFACTPRHGTPSKTARQHQLTRGW